MTTTITVPDLNGQVGSYEVVGQPISAPSTRSREITSREVYAAGHIVVDPLRSSRGSPVIDWDATMRFRHHLWSLGLGVAEAMDTAQRGQGFPVNQLAELIRRTAAEAASVGGSAAFGIATDQLPATASSLEEIIDGYLEQLGLVEQAGGRAVLMASRQLSARASGPEDYEKVYDAILAAASRPVILHWLGEQFDDAMAGYWGLPDFDSAARTVLSIMHAHPTKIRGIKLSLLSVDAEVSLRARLPAGMHMYTGDDFHYPQLISGIDGVGGSDALLGAFDPLATVASAAFARLDEGDAEGFVGLLEPTVPLSRQVFAAPTSDYKTGVVFLAYLNGHQDSFRMLGGAESARSVLHLCETFRLADQCGALTNPDLAVERLIRLLDSAGLTQ